MVLSVYRGINGTAVSTLSVKISHLVCASLGKSSLCLSYALSILCINAFIYAAKYGEFQDGVRRLMSILRCRFYHQESIHDPGLDMTNFVGLDRPINSGNSGNALGGTSGSTDVPARTYDASVIRSNPMSFKGGRG